MRNEKRYGLTIALLIVWMMAFPYVMKLLGLAPPPKKPPAVAAGAVEPEKKSEPEKAKAQEPARDLAAKGEEPAKKASAPALAAAAPSKPEVTPVEESELVLGSETDTSPGGYKLRAQLIQKGAGVESLSSSRYDAEFKEGKAVKRPLELIEKDRTWPAAFTLTLNTSPDGGGAAADPDDDEVAIAAREAEDRLDSITWEVVRDEQGQIRRTVSVIDPATNAAVEGQAIVFRTTAHDGVVVTKTFRLGKGIDGLEVQLQFESPDKERKVVYNLRGPQGIPIEGEWYTSTFRDLFFGQLNQDRIKTESYSANDVAKAGDKAPENTALPLAYAGVENQYFATLMEPFPLPKGQEDRWDSRTVALWHRDTANTDALHKSDIGVRLTSRPVAVAPAQPVVHTYRVFAGPKMADALRPYSAENLASYRKNQWILLAPEIARYVISPGLDMIYGLTESVARLFGWHKGNYGIAIILLTMLVRALMFPLGRKQALAAQKMQVLQPHLKAIQEKYKDDKERLTKETFALYKKHSVNPMGGCIPALIQLPIFVGLWQALNTSVPLRHAKFLWIRDLAAPDMLFHLPFEVPWLGWTWFNLLPFLVVFLMLVQTQLFSPPATTPEAEQTQKMMKVMMVVMGVMFYKVPSGLGIYFITSSLWAIGERLLLPKVTHADLNAAPAADGGEAGGDKPSGPGGRGGGGGNGDGRGPRGKGPSGGNGTEGKPQGRFAQFWERVLDEARKDSTFRKDEEERESRGRDRSNPRAPRPRRR